jgi:hypothetical protein
MTIDLAFQSNWLQMDHVYNISTYNYGEKIDNAIVGNSLLSMHPHGLVTRKFLRKNSDIDRNNVLSWNHKSV